MGEATGTWVDVAIMIEKMGKGIPEDGQSHGQKSIYATDCLGSVLGFE